MGEVYRQYGDVITTIPWYVLYLRNVSWQQSAPRVKAVRTAQQSKNFALKLCERPFWNHWSDCNGTVKIQCDARGCCQHPPDHSLHSTWRVIDPSIESNLRFNSQIPWGRISYAQLPVILDIINLNLILRVLCSISFINDLWKSNPVSGKINYMFWLTLLYHMTNLLLFSTYYCLLLNKIVLHICY